MFVQIFVFYTLLFQPIIWGITLLYSKDGVASFNESGHKWALGHFVNSLGAEGDVAK